ncbi:Protein kinase [Claviceps aff. purpurea]|uniref:non-specific serine/threonine protein kinase n=1 Tax=Claviceps aff. purpurea TaxID=1967640 RepID=A0A9P7QDZ9_9HYPO|nr:Protein kinase [Claviceps aff. purpurea]
MPPGGAFDDEELTMSLSHRPQQPAPPPRQRRHPSRDDSVKSPKSSANRQNAPGSSSRKPRTKTEQRIGAYKIVRTLGEGSFGKVRLAIHQGTGQQVALKIIARKKLISRDMAGRVEREIEYLQLLRHPHIIKLYTVIKTQTEIIMVLEYAAGELFDYIVQNGRMKEPEARRFFQQMLCAVEYCHRHKIVHRDLKPENLLLDDNLNVKIADFGLSNIMTDGNFLKTSCGSPNYAAPEVIGGKLYAGPEVDVWSCGIILYVLLVGRLPFDDEHIPSLFAKIARGTYSIPPWMSSGAENLIKKMLVVNPVQRVTIEEIRQDPWFLTDLPVYLQPPVEEFLNTGVDPNKAIEKRDIAPNASVQMQEKLHNEVTEKISKTMGYGRTDVEEALQSDEPSAIKDAYMIVRENKIMAVTQGQDVMTPDVEEMSSPMMSISSARSGASGMVPSRPYVSKVGVLPTSLTTYHKEYIEQQKAGVESQPSEASAFSDEPTTARTEAEKEEAARRLKPHARVQRGTEDAGKRPQSLTPINPPRKLKPARWQFGIRSRNAPWEALLCIHKALHKLGAKYILDEEQAHAQAEAEAEAQAQAQAQAQDQEIETPQGDESLDDYDDQSQDPIPTSLEQSTKYKLPADPWHIKVRWEASTLEQHVQASTDPGDRSLAGTPESHLLSSMDPTRQTGFMALLMDIQIYEMEPGVFLVDFKCAGYETPDGRVLEEKEVTSPFPFLDMTARLIMQLAEAD